MLVLEANSDWRIDCRVLIVVVLGCERVEAMNLSWWWVGMSGGAASYLALVFAFPFLERWWLAGLIK